MTGRRVLLVEPWLAGSHEAWARGWQAASRHEIQLLAHEGRAWRWRMRGASVTLAADAERWVAEHGRPDLVVGTDMLDLAAFLGAARRSLGSVPAALYLHENQLTYPRRPGEALDQGLAWTTWRSLVVADAVWCNSAFHRDDLLGALPALLAGVADHGHGDRFAEVAGRCSVLPVGVDLAAAATPTGAARPAPPDGPLVLSNQRWHHDKDLGAVLRALVRLADRGVAFRVAVVGDDRGGEREALMPLVERLGDRVVAVGMLPRSEYLALLHRADIVVSAARNEFFGIAVVEAIAAGAVPVLPDRLAYPEVVPARFHEHVLYADGQLTAALGGTIESLGATRAAVDGLADSMHRFDWTEVAPGYDAAVDRLAHPPRPPVGSPSAG